MTQTKPLDLLKSTARTGLRFGKVIGTQVGRAAVVGAGKAREQVSEYAARRRPLPRPIETFVPSPRRPEADPAPARESAPAAAPEVPAAGTPDATPPAAAPTPAEVAKRVTRKPAPKAPASKSSSRPAKKSVPGAKLPPRRREEPATGE